MNLFGQNIIIPSDLFDKLLSSAFIFTLLFVLRLLINFLVKRRVEDVKRAYHIRKINLYLFGILTVVLIGRIWIKGIDSISTYMGLLSAGVAIAMHDTIANIAGWFFIMSRRPFRVGDRIEISGTAGDVVDIRLFQFSIIEIGNWVDADQSTGRLIHIPNSHVMKEPLANFNIGFEYIWHEIPILITFESDWKKAKEILTEIVYREAEHHSKGALAQIRQATEKYMIYFSKLTPIVYTTVKDSGVLLTIRYMVDPRKRRSTEERIWEDILEAFAEQKNIDLAYPTTRFYDLRHLDEDKNE